MAYPRILHNNIIAKAASVVASSTGAGYAVANLGDGRPYTWWAPSAAPATLEIDAGVAMEADGLYIPTHTLDSSLWDVSLYAADLPFSGMQLLTNPESAWTAQNGTVTDNAAAAPDGTATADKFVAGATASLHGAYKSYSTSIGITYTFSIYVKAAEYSRVRISDNAFSKWGVTYDLTTGTLIASGGTDFVSSSIGSLDANGYYRISVTFTASVVTTYFATCGVPSSYIGSGGSGYSAAGDGVSGLYIWGAMLNVGSTVAPYIPQTAGRWISETALAMSNRIPNPADLSTGFTGAASLTANYAHAPNGAKEATLITDSSAVVIEERYLYFTELHSSEGSHVFSIYLKKTSGVTNYCGLFLFKSIGGTSNSQGIVIDTNNGLITASIGTPTGYGIEDAGDYWWVWVMASNAGASSNSGVFAYVYPAYNSDGSATQNVAATGSEIIWGAKLEKTLGRPAPYRANAPIYLPFTSTTKRYWLLRLNRKSGTALAAMAVCMVGKALTFPTGLPQGTDPLGRKVMGQRNQNEAGQPLGRTVDFEQQDVQLTFERVTWAWLRGVFVPAWRRGLRSEPFGFIWDYEAAVEDVALVTSSEDFRTPHNSGSLADLQLTVSGVVT